MKMISHNYWKKLVSYTEQKKNNFLYLRKKLKQKSKVKLIKLIEAITSA